MKLDVKIYLVLTIVSAVNSVKKDPLFVRITTEEPTHELEQIYN